ncbi:hypothetical protein A2738_00830 [Candidatus Nomurabacteria bacterium RIFCSPHIGHO2_01_FULL_42_15]|uniref:Enolase n=1 Tax=Candidatus Nomurabacteria bacterium RIFCSPHIGHO2_01_FULL_42_15 TaxID=1801742 RepID=A0A1F6VFK0_9BACT|nr:MAG: hypothetical protein A2738_00830 [Candidatus Nomurabacteria bacterium RIFCSPHIGHO2_01_FULL_42_15]OGI93158.1 MAG: hypothetical protein A3A99_01340 [Candidatus Nomurabacteria bacterium RIFCSPLOWO2_01_FULL_41_18]
MAELTNFPITKILAKEIKDSHGNPTIEVTVFACPPLAGAGAASGTFSVPSGASTGSHEAHELRDKDGLGVKDAIEKVNTVIAPRLVNQNVLNQKEIDRIIIELDGTPNKDNLGGNSMIGVSIACAKAAAKATDQEVYQYLGTLVEIKPSRKTPYLFMNLLEGGRHTKSGLAFQEYHVIPQTDDINEAIDIGIKVQASLEDIIKNDLGKESVVLGDEGGFAPEVSDIRKPLMYLTEAVGRNNLEGKVRFALDVAASSFYGNGVYQVDGKNISKEELMKIYDSLIAEFNLLSIEDPFNEEDFESFGTLGRNHSRLKVVGDDLTVTNVLRLKKAIEMRSINAMIIKPNQIGTLSETLEVMKVAREGGIELIVSHRGEETNDDFIADLAFAFGCFGLKSGAPLKPERKVKYDRLVKISGK